MTMFEWHANLVESAANNLAFWIEKTRADKVSWVPKTDESTNTRCALQLGSECVNVNRRMSLMFRGDSPSFDEMEYTDTTSCAAELRASGKELADSIRGLTPETVAKEYETPFGPMPGALLMQIALNNMSYHGGQVNLIQLLYGDPKFYVPGRD
jgi:hypothetical protein